MTSIRPKPCPFCGKIPMLNSKYHDVECSNGSCAVLPSTWLCDTDEEAIELWNTRFFDEELKALGEPYGTKTYDDGKWEMFESISSAWYGKQCYFKEDDGMIYSRISGYRMTLDAAICEFTGMINNEY